MDIDEALIEFNRVMKNIDNYFSDPQSDLEIFRLLNTPPLHTK